MCNAVGICALVDSLEADEPDTCKIDFRERLGDLIGKPFHFPSGFQENNQCLAGSVSSAALLLFEFDGIQDQSLDVRWFAFGRAGHHYMLGLPCTFRFGIIDDSVTAGRITGEVEALGSYFCIVDDLNEPVRQHFARPHITKSFERLSGLEMSAVANERLKLLEGDSEIFESFDRMLHG
jgi:hypothetical protein